MKRFSKILIFILIFMGFQHIGAGPTVVRDNRITDTGITPTLGRGYSVSTNTFQSTCLAELTRTAPSYDFTYTFKELTSETTTSNSVSTTKPITSDRVINSTFNTYLREILKKTGESTSKDTSKVQKHRMVAVINLDSYYSSVDEAKSKLSDSAGQLLNTGDIPGFFSSCGPYYVRSINRRAKLISVFEFTAKDSTQRKTFAGQIESELKSFRKVIRTRTTGWWFWKKTVRTESWEQQSSTQETYAQNENFEKTAKETNLTITTAAFGLGKNKEASIISYGIETFKAAIKDAFISMQDPATGKVTSIEVVPWVENTEFQVLTKLNQKLFIPKLDADGKETGEKTELTIPMFQKKYNLVTNGEFIAEIDRTYRNLMNIFYKARLCRAYIDENWKKAKKGGAPNEREWKPGFKDKLLINNKTGRRSDITANALYTELETGLSDTNQKNLLNSAYDFMNYGTPSGQKCISALLNYQMVGQPYFKIGQCKQLSAKMGVIINETIDNHCMPMQ